MEPDAKLDILELSSKNKVLPLQTLNSLLALPPQSKQDRLYEGCPESIQPF
jgi:hypothetical protein